MGRPSLKIDVATKDQQELRTLLKGGVQQVRVILRALAAAKDCGMKAERLPCERHPGCAGRLLRRRIDGPIYVSEPFVVLTWLHATRPRRCFECSVWFGLVLPSFVTLGSPKAGDSCRRE